LGQFYGHGTVNCPGSTRHPATAKALADSSCQQQLPGKLS